MPLYSCQRCGWATASSWRDAVQGHEQGCPSCTGSVELVPLGGRPQDNVAAVERVGRPFDMRESIDLDGALRLSLLGGLDIVVSERLTTRLAVLRASGRPVRIDLTELEFIDCTGLEAIIEELTAARRGGRSLEIDRPVSAPVKRVITFMDVSAVLWPTEPVDERPPLRVIEGDASSEAERTDALRPPTREAGGSHSLALVAGDSAPPDQPRSPRSPGAAGGTAT